MHLTIATITTLPFIPLLTLLSGLMFVEPDAVIVGIGILIHVGIVPLLWGVLISVVFGFLNDLLWFRIGMHIKGKDHRLIKWIEKITTKTDVHLNAHPFKAIFFTKFMYGIVGIHRATVIRLGMNHLSMRMFILYNGISVTVWALALIGLGYFASDSISHINHVIRIVEVVFVALVIFYIVVHNIKKARIKRP